MTTSLPVTIGIKGMTCGHCVAAVQEALATIPGIVSARVALGSADLDIRSTTPAQITSDAIRAVELAGYEATVHAGAPALAPTSCCSAPAQHQLARAEG